MTLDADTDTEDETEADEGDGSPEMNLGDSCAHGVREDRDCADCRADACPGGGGCGCPGNVPPSKRHDFRNRY